MKKHISIDQLRPGMYLIGIDQSWWNTPFIRHHRLIKSAEEILKLKQSGVKEVEIDVFKGLDVEIPVVEGEAETTLLKNETKSEVEGTVEDPAEPGFIHAGVGGLSVEPIPGQHPSSNVQSILSALQEEAQAEVVRDAAIQAVEKIFEGVVTGVPVDYPFLQETTETIVRHITAHAKSMTQLVLLKNLRSFDKHIFGHVVDVCALSVVIGIELGWTEEQLQEVGLGALLHDIGYLRLPANLLQQRHRRVQTESNLLDQHPQLGVSLLKQSPDVPASILRLVQEHHERLDGSGIPEGLANNMICPASQLIALIDQFDSLTSHWGIAPQQPSALVLRELYAEAKSGKFDVQVVERMIRCLGIYPVGSLVELSTKERGIVTMVNPEDLLKPMIKVISDEQGLLYPSPFVVDLAETGSQPPRHITLLLDPVYEEIQVGKYFSLVGTSMA